MRNLSAIRRVYSSFCKSIVPALFALPITAISAWQWKRYPLSLTLIFIYLYPPLKKVLSALAREPLGKGEMFSPLAKRGISVVSSLVPFPNWSCVYALGTCKSKLFDSIVRGTSEIADELSEASSVGYWRDLLMLLMGCFLLLDSSYDRNERSWAVRSVLRWAMARSCKVGSTCE